MIPVPLSATVCVETPLPTFTLSVAVTGPTAAGSNTTLIAQLAPTATEAPQVLLCENGCGLEVESATLVIGSATAPVFVTVTVFAALEEFVI